MRERSAVDSRVEMGCETIVVLKTSGEGYTSRSCYIECESEIWNIS